GPAIAVTLALGVVYTVLMAASIPANALWERIASPAFLELDPAAARAILRLKFKPADVNRIHELSNKAKNDTLGEPERAELDLYPQIGHLLTLVHTKAPIALKSSNRRKR